MADRFNLIRRYDFNQIEEDVKSLWKENKDEIVVKAVSYDPSKEMYSFLEGPPTANAPPGLHHVEMRVFKDLFCRFKHMQGYTVPRKGGWDCHGLPVEVQVEKKLGLNSKKEVLDYGESKFIDECKKDVFSFIKEWDTMTEHMAFWVDLENPYMTLSKDYMESVWWSLATLFNKGYLYEGYKVVPYCPRCETPLSSHEVALGYEEVREPSVTVRFKLKDDDRVLLAWTTTPWTLISNLALAVNPDVKYATFKAKDDDRKYVMAEELIPQYFDDYEILETFPGKELEGKYYEPIYDFSRKEIEKQEGKDAWKVVLADYVTTEEGTGVVHQAPAFGEDDYNTCTSNGIAFVNLVNKDGTYTDDVDNYKGRFVKDCDEDIIKELEDRDILLKKKDYTHSYPFCWRCKSPLLYYAMDSWFISVSKFRERMSELNQTINWYPNHLKDGRFGNWLEGAKDWAVSRNKFWGTPLPIWKCECGEKHAIGSVEELNKLTGENVEDLHKDTVDKLTIKCKCGKDMHRTSEVIDTWYDSGSASFAQYHYPFENKEMVEKSFPYSFIAEAIDQTRGWFYTLHVLGTMLFDDIAYRNVGVGGHLCDEAGEKMSKSKGNVIMPNDMFNKFGVDAVRLLFTQYGLGSNIKFGEGALKENIMPFLTTLWNSFLFARYYLDDNPAPEEMPSDLRVEDKWMLNKTNIVVKRFTELLESHNENHCFSLLQEFILDDFSRWYIKLVRDRTDEKDDALSYVFNHVIDVAARLLAPFAPYVSEYIYQEALRKEGRPISVHHESWPEPGKIDEESDSRMSRARDLVQGILSVRDKSQIGVRWPLAEVIITSEDEGISAVLEEFGELIKKQTNVKEIKIKDSFEHLEFSMKPNYRSMGESFGEQTADAITEMKKLDFEELTKEMVEGKSHKVKSGENEFELLPEHFNIEKKAKDPFEFSDFKGGSIYISKEIPEELFKEGLAREIIRRIQALRKKAGLEKKDTISLYVHVDEDVKSAVSGILQSAKKKIGAKDIKVSSEKPSKEYEHKEDATVKGKSFSVYF